jgi:hypothetical protein
VLGRGPHGRDVALVVHQEELGVVGGARIHELHAWRVEQAELAHEAHG